MKLPKLFLHAKAINTVSFLSFIFVGVLAVSTAWADTTPPTSSTAKTPPIPNGKNDWYVSPVQVQISATDAESGVKEINYKINSSSWNKVSFTNSLNLAPNASFETIDNGNTPIIQDWSATIQDADTTYSRDTSTYAPGFSNTSAKIVTTGTGWHGINNQLNFAAATPLSNMSASVKFKTENVTTLAFFKVYLVSQDAGGNLSYTYITQSAGQFGTADWSTQSVNFVANDPNAVGVYLDIGLNDAGTVWIDAASITQTAVSADTVFSVGANGTHTVEYYAVDNSGNAEVHSCTAPKVNCLEFNIDQTPPGNWHDAEAVRGTGGSDHELFVYATVEDAVSGMSTLSNKYMYHIDTEDGFGRYENLLHCNTPWQENTWVDLISEPFGDGDLQAILKTQKTDFCNNDWKICKTVKFYAEDMAGNVTTKDFCLNGPWLQFSGGGAVKANGGIDMVSEPEEENSDGLVELGNDLMGFFTTSKDWVLMDSPGLKDYDYNGWVDRVKTTPTTISSLNSNAGVYLINGNIDITNAKVPNNYGSATFSQIVFVNGDLRVSTNFGVGTNSAALFIVKGKVEIAKSVETVGVGILADGDFYTAYNTSEGDTTKTLNLNGIYAANLFHFQRTLQGSNNSKYPSEHFVFEPKYMIKLASFLGTNSIKWIRED